MKQLKTIATDMEEHRKKINNLSNKNITLKHEDENIGREIRSTRLQICILYYYLYLFIITHTNYALYI